MMQAGTSTSAKPLVQPAVQANKEHQYALKVYTERLEAELEHLDRLLTAAGVSDNEEDDITNAGGSVTIPGAARPKSILPPSDLISETSPFYHDAFRKQCYEEFTVVHPMKAAELEALADAVRSENYRLYALQSQAQGLPSFTGLSDPPAGFINANKHGIDWERVAQKVSSASPSVQRTARECEIRWLGDRHPQFSDAQWTQAEIARVKELVGGDAREGQVDWVAISEKLGTGRTPVDCMRHAIMRRTHSWTPDTDQRLLEAVDIYGTDCWALVARYVSEDATATQCQSRYLRTLDPTLKRGPWTPDEDERLKQAVAVFGHVWIDVATFVEGRNNEQCRDRYQEYLSPTVTKGKWTEEQDAALFRAVEQVGLGKWKEVSKVLNIGRTDNMCRLRYGVLTKPKKLGKTAVRASTETQWVHEEPSQSTPRAPSRARTKQSSNHSTPVEQSTSDNFAQPQSQFLILHPETYIPQSSSSTPTPETVPKPKPRPRKKKPPAAAEIVEPGVAQVEQSTDTPPSASAPNDPTTANVIPPSEGVSTDTTQKRPRSETEDETETQPNKKRRTKNPSPASNAPQPDATNRETIGGGRSTLRSSAALPVDSPATGTRCRGETPHPQDVQILPAAAPETLEPSKIPDTTTEGGDLVDSLPPSRGRGRGRGRPRGRGRGRGRGRRRGRGGETPNDPPVGSETNSGEGTAEYADKNRDEGNSTPHTVGQCTEMSPQENRPEAPQTPSRPRKKAGTSPAAAPTRRQPARAANRSSRPSLPASDHDMEP
ncbi:hypothetical protein BC628DRAFT_1537943 [Trametes gibbosa]|nr:hypothetical protein BC628DRAFT_1537943 [Trametes gibbosa]